MDQRRAFDDKVKNSDENFLERERSCRELEDRAKLLLEEADRRDRNKLPFAEAESKESARHFARLKLEKETLQVRLSQAYFTLNASMRTKVILGD